MRRYHRARYAPKGSSGKWKTLKKGFSEAQKRLRVLHFREQPLRLAYLCPIGDESPKTFIFKSVSSWPLYSWVSPRGTRTTLFWEKYLKLTVKIRDFGENDAPFKILATPLAQRVRALVFSARRYCRRSRVRAPVWPGTFLRKNINIYYTGKGSTRDPNPQPHQRWEMLISSATLTESTRISRRHIPSHVY
jgi:hypothetical protein